MNSNFSIFGLFFIAVLSNIVLGFIIAYPIQLLWNYSLVGLIQGIGEISFMQAAGLFVLLNIFRINIFSQTKKNK